ncbi:kinase-like domain-containing protein, partial [Hygrophoropsis aurantiaca]
MTPTAPERPVRYYKHYLDVENVNKYRKGGYHPVHIGDIIHDRYRVVNKLGHGAYSTVWLVKDDSVGRHASLKVVAADASEVTLLRRLKQIQADSPDVPGGEFVVKVFDDFTVDGPNGTHQCIVTEVLGPPLDLNPLQSEDYIYPPDAAKKMIAQIAHGVAYLHRIGIVHGDLHLRNFALHAPEMESLSDGDVQKYFDGPRMMQPESTPTTAYRTTEPSSALVAHLPGAVHIKICDFGEAFLWRGEPQQVALHTPHAHAAPEILFKDPVTPAVDVWSMAVLAHCLLSGAYMFEPPNAGSVVFEWVLKLGKLPDRWWAKWGERARSFDDEGVYI